MGESSTQATLHHTGWQVACDEAVLDAVAGPSITPTLQAGVLLLRRLQHVVTAQTLERREKNQKNILSATQTLQ